MPPVHPMLAKTAAALPTGMRYEPKWDGFRAIVFRDGDEVELGSRSTKPLTRYFPELVAALREQLLYALCAGRRDRRRPRRASWTSTGCWNASTRPTPGYAIWPR